MSYLPQFQFDVFLSYGWAGSNVPFSGDPSWVTELHLRLLEELRGNFRQISLYFDLERSLAGDVLENTLAASRSSAIFLFISTPDSEREASYCRDELRAFSEAEDALRKSLAIRETPQALNNLGAALCFQGRYEEAATYQEKALMYQPKGPLLLLLLTNIADNLRLAGHKLEAMSHYHHASDEALAELTAESNAADVRGTFAYICARLGDRVRAEQEIKQAINSAPDDSDVLRSAVLTYEALGQRGLAIEASRGMAAAQLKHLTREPDLADFSRDSRFIQQTIDKGGQ